MFRLAGWLTASAAVLCMIGCASSKGADVSFDPFPYPMGEGEVLQSSYNSDSTFVVRQTVLSKSMTSPRRHIRFALYDALTGSMIFSDELEDAALSWRSANELEVERRLGIIPAEEGFNEYLHGYIFEIQSRTKRPRDGHIHRPDSN